MTGIPVSSDLLARELVERAVLRGRFTLRSGAISDYYIDKYRFGTDPELLRPIATAIAAQLPSDTQRVAGTVLGAVPLAVAVSLRSGLPSVLVRPETKDHGTAKRVEGQLDRGDRVVLLEDVVTTGGAALEALAALRDAGAEPILILAVVDREEGGAAAFGEARVAYRPLYTRTQLGLGGS
jgi:orotate phosphoribosyltransferase